MAATMMMTGIIMFPQLGSRLQLRASCSWVALRILDLPFPLKRTGGKRDCAS